MLPVEILNVSFRSEMKGLLAVLCKELARNEGKSNISAKALASFAFDSC